MLEKGIIFSADALVEISCLCNASTLEKAVMQSSGRFSPDDMDTLCGCIPDALIKKVAKNRHLPLPEYLCENPPAKQKSARAERGYVYSPSECLAMGLYPDDKLYKLYLRFKVLMGDKW